MEFEQLTGRYRRLRQELANAYAARPWHYGRIVRLVNDLASIERQLSNASHADKPFDERVRPDGLAHQAR